MSAHQAMLKEIKIADIVVGQRHRRDMGDHTTSWPTQNPMSRRPPRQAGGSGVLPQNQGLSLGAGDASNIFSLLLRSSNSIRRFKSAVSPDLTCRSSSFKTA